VTIAIRPAHRDDGLLLRVLERQAGERFREAGLGWVADAEPASVDVLADYAEAGRSWVAVDGAGEPVGYALVDVVDGGAHVEQVSVRPDHQGRGVGRALLGQVRSWALDQRFSAITLTTFADVAWNRPLYEHLGFRVLSEAEIGPGLRGVRDEEAAHGLDPSTRVCMILELEDARDV
jgi:GNAT superfamily N-acetyltransferase